VHHQSLSPPVKHVDSTNPMIPQKNWVFGGRRKSVVPPTAKREFITLLMAADRERRRCNVPLKAEYRPGHAGLAARRQTGAPTAGRNVHVHLSDSEGSRSFGIPRWSNKDDATELWIHTWAASSGRRSLGHCQLASPVRGFDAGHERRS
jgi:hypothetical protein